MTSVRTFAALLATGLVACGGQPEAPSPSTTPLGYSVPVRTPIEYSSSDTARINIEVQPGMSMEQTMGQSSHVRFSFAPTVGTDGNLSVTATYVDFAAYAESSMAPRQDIDGSMLEGGEFVLSLSPDGEVDQVSGPELPEVIEGLTMGGDNLFADFFVRLPNRLVQPGESWTDTISAVTEEEGARSENTTIVVSTFRGDTTVAGRRLWIIDATKSAAVLVEGNMQGMEMRNELSGTVTEHALWDPNLRAIYSSSAQGSMTGTLDVPSAGMTGIPISVSNHRRIRLVESAN
ncbi:MAG TPA: hypothetical protein VF039_08320 [Longimicrobiales bacterium]